MDMADLSSPENSRWALIGITKCGQRGYLRPCQVVEQRAAESDDTFPLAKICTSPKEMVVVVEDDDDLRDELIEMIREHRYPVVGLRSFVEFKNVAQDYQTGCIILDIRLPGQDGLSIQEWLNSIEFPLPIIFISGVRDVSTVVHAMKAGAVEFLPKPFDEMALRRAINAAIGLSHQRHCRQASQKMVKDLIDTLTPSELVVANMIAQGYPTKVIAGELGRSENTIKIHRHRVFSKLQVNSAASVGNIIHHLAEYGR
ncbi:MAG: response regulator [Formivibrio sp.]|nr:response regulator [Formivibrio sp.]